MIVVRVELWPQGSEARKREIGRMSVVNTGEMRADGRYRYRYTESEESGIALHYREQNCWRLIGACCEHMKWKKKDGDGER